MDGGDRWRGHGLRPPGGAGYLGRASFDELFDEPITESSVRSGTGAVAPLMCMSGSLDEVWVVLWRRHQN
jgi:hypothetical protein